MPTTTGKFGDIFSGSVSALSKSVFRNWMESLRTAKSKGHRAELIVLFHTHARGLLPEHKGATQGEADRWIQEMGQVVDSTRFICTSPVWDAVICISEGRFETEIWRGTDHNRCLLAAAARAVREFLIAEETKTYVAHWSAR